MLLIVLFHLFLTKNGRSQQKQKAKISTAYVHVGLHKTMIDWKTICLSERFGDLCSSGEAKVDPKQR